MPEIGDSFHMINLINKIKIVLQNRKGETLTESVASLFVFSILMLAVATMISLSLRITGNSTESAKINQEKFINPIIHEEWLESSSRDDTLNLIGNHDDININIDVGVKVFQDNRKIFVPKVTL